MAFLAPLFIWLMVPSGCGRDLRTAQGVAEEFLDQHYVNIDIPKAKQYAVGLALEKLNEETRLTAGQTIDASTQKPRINYRLLEKKDGATRASFLYEGTIQSNDGSSFTRKWLIAVRKDATQWVTLPNLIRQPDMSEPWQEVARHPPPPELRLPKWLLAALVLSVMPVPPQSSRSRLPKERQIGSRPSRSGGRPPSKP